MSLQLFAVAGIGEIVAGADIAQIIVDHVAGPLRDGDVVIVTSKIVSKAAGLVTTADRDDVVAAQTDRVVATRGQTRIVRTHHGLTLAAAGIDASNLTLGQVVPLPDDPDLAARDLRARLIALTGAEVAVIVTDTAGRAWRVGQTDIAIGAAGIKPYLDFTGVEDAYGNVLAVTAPAIADELAGAADLVAEKLGGIPVVIARGLPADWLLADDPVGAAALIRDEGGDLFGLGARDAVLAACGPAAAPRGFPADEDNTVDELLRRSQHGTEPTRARVRIRDAGRLQVFSVAAAPGPADWIAVGALAERLRVLARAMRLDVVIEVDGG